MSLRCIPIRRAGNRTNLFMGGDRELVMLAGLFSSVLIVCAQDWRATGFGIFLWFSALFACRLMAKADPKMRQIYYRHLKYLTYYPPKSTPYRSEYTAKLSSRLFDAKGIMKSTTPY